MRSTSASPDGRRPTDDRTARARIRDAAIALVAERGTGALSARAVAGASGVSPGLVIHHFGSMDALRVSCDEHVVELIREAKNAAFATGAELDVMALLREDGMGPVAAYLAATLAEGSPAVAHLVDEMVADAEAYLARGVDSGMLRPSADPHGRAVVLTLWGLGALALNSHLHRLLGVDLTADRLGTLPSIAAYLGPVHELYAHGLFTQDFAEQMARSLHAAAPETAPPTTTPAPSEGEPS